VQNIDWPYPGARWWKFDFHTHTPASRDTDAWQQAVGTPDEVTPEKWLLQYMAAGIDCVAVTDHNSGAWIDRLKDAYAQMQAQADSGNAPTGFRPLTIFPGVEISANGGIHVLAIFDPSFTTSDIDSLLGAVEYEGTKGDSDGETRKSVAEVIAKIIERGGIAIPAHADSPKGLLRVNPGTRQCALSAHTVRQALEVEGLLAVERCDPTNHYPEAVDRLAAPLARVLGSDCHHFSGNKTPGSAYTWVKMAQPTLEGLRLALLDGNGVSIRRSDEGSFDPFKTPTHLIRAIEIEKARVMGHHPPARLDLSPYFNAIVGGRGTGKSTIVHVLRLATRREDELPVGSEPRERFEAFRQIAKRRDDQGALRAETTIRVEWQYDQTRLRLRWIDGGKTLQVEEYRDGNWQPSSSQSVNPDRFPIRIFSQGQIAAMVEGGRQTLLRIIDEAGGIGPLVQVYEEARRAFLAQSARLREIDAKLTQLPEVQRRLKELIAKLNTLTQTEHAAVLKAYARSQRQHHMIEETLAQLREGVKALSEVAERLLLDDWPPQFFDPQEDADLLGWRAHADRAMVKARQQLEQAAAALKEEIDHLTGDARLDQWRKRATEARDRHEQWQAQLAEQGVADPQAFARLTQERQQLEAQERELRQLQADREALAQQVQSQQALVLARRQAITRQRQAFLDKHLSNNPHVRMQVVPFGFDAQVIERSLRALIDAEDERFAEDMEGLATALAEAQDKLIMIEQIRERLLEPEPSFHGRFRNYLSKRWEKPEWADHVRLWYPEDDLRIEYQRDQRWYAISQGSQGQRSAALLAFLLAFGDEPIVLDQPEDDLDNHLIYDLIVRQIRENKLRRQLIIVTHNPNVVVNGDAELVHVMDFGSGQCYVKESGALQEKTVREEVCRVMEGGREAFARRWKRLGQEV
jgi:ABC-type lipoprotein export system ATPase subunit